MPQLLLRDDLEEPEFDFDLDRDRDLEGEDAEGEELRDLDLELGELLGERRRLRSLCYCNLSQVQIHSSVHEMHCNQAHHAIPHVHNQTLKGIGILMLVIVVFEVSFVLGSYVSHGKNHVHHDHLDLVNHDANLGFFVDNHDEKRENGSVNEKEIYE